MIHRGEEKRAKLSTTRMQILKTIPRQQAREKLLCQVLRFVFLMPFASNVGVKWIPVGGTQLPQGFMGNSRGAMSRSLNDAPMRRDKPIGLLSEELFPFF